MNLDRDVQGLRIGCNPVYVAQIEWRVHEKVRPGVQYPIFARRVDLDGATSPRVLKTNEPILPGHYELMVQTGPLHYAQSIRASFVPPPTKEAGWFGMDFGNQTRLTVLLSDNPATIAGSVTSGSRPVAGAVIYLESFDPDLPDPRLQLWSGRTDHTGKYMFAGLAPGRYRLVSTFGFDPDDRYAMTMAKEVKVEEGATAMVDLELILR
jgi:hypothetical protein